MSRRIRAAFAGIATALALLAATGAWTALPAQAGITFNVID
jgi:hypothetical protein